jgi:acetolactate synthase-1/2/3 large subunit
MSIKTNSYACSFVRALQRRGIRDVFANSGTDHAPIVEALAAMHKAGEATPAFHVVPHENLAMAMAQGYYRSSGKPAVVLVHVTIGTANTVCSLLNAWRSNIPVLLVAGRNPSSQEGHTGSRSGSTPAPKYSFGMPTRRPARGFASRASSASRV